MVGPSDRQQHHDTKRIDQHADKDDAKVADQFGPADNHVAGMFDGKDTSRRDHRRKNTNHDDRHGKQEDPTDLLHHGQRLQWRRIEEINQPGQDGNRPVVKTHKDEVIYRPPRRWQASCNCVPMKRIW